MLIDMTPKPSVIETDDIGTLVQPLDEDIVSDKDYVHTDNNLTEEVLQDISANTQKVSNVDHPVVETPVPLDAKFTDTVYIKPTSEPISYIKELQSTLDSKLTSDGVQEAIGTVTHDMSGFENRVDSYISFDANTRTFTIGSVSTPAKYYYRGQEAFITNPLSFVIPDVSGGLYINIDAPTNSLYNGGKHGGILTDVLCGYVYWDAVNQEALTFGDERHAASADTQWHYSQHRDVGAIWRSGGGLTYTLDDDAAISLEVGTPMGIADEDLEHLIAHSVDGIEAYSQPLAGEAQIPVMYLSGTSYVQIPPSIHPWVGGISTARINQIDNGTGSLVDAGEGKFISYWMLASNDSINPIKLLLGRKAFDSVDEAYAETYDSYGLDLAENVPMYHFAIETSSLLLSTAKVKIAGVRLIAQRTVTSSSAFSASSHDSLTGRSLGNQHPINAIRDLEESLDVKQVALVYGATRLVQTQRIMAQMVLRGQT